MKHPVAAAAVAALLMATAHGTAAASNFYANQITVIYDWTIYKALPVNVSLRTEGIVCGPMRFPKTGSPKSGGMVTIDISEFCNEGTLIKLGRARMWAIVEATPAGAETQSEEVCRDEAQTIKYNEIEGEPLGILVTFDAQGAFTTKCLY